MIAVTELLRSELLCVPKRRRLVHDKLTDSDGREVLHIFYGQKEIIFDEPELLPFGTMLLETESFRAEEAIGWSNGEPHEWDKVRELLEALLDEEILKRVTEAAAAPKMQTQAYPLTLGLAPPGREARTFSAHDDRCPVITKEAFGRAVDLGNLEAVIPLYRVAHPAKDRDGRQVGENNVTPRFLFLDPPTQRRVCNYAGDRYQAEGPMNVTALKLMTSRWPELLSLSEQLRQALFARLPPRDGARLRIGEVHLLAVCTLAATGYVMIRGQDPVPNGELDPGLAGMFRLIDGVRLVTTESMRMIAGEPGCDRPMNARSIADFAEREGTYHGTHGVCAGPAALIDEYLRVLLGEESAPIQVVPDIAARVGDLDAALEYGLRGQRIESLVRIFGASQGLLHDRLRVSLAEQQPRTDLHALLDAPIDTEHYELLRVDHSLVDTFVLENAVNRWLLARAGEGLRDGDGREMLELDPGRKCEEPARIAEFLARALPDHPALSARARAELAAVAADVFALERRCLRAVGDEMRLLNERIGRTPGRPLTGEDLAVYNRPRTGPTFAATLKVGLGLGVHTDATSTVLSCGDHQLSLTD